MNMMDGIIILDDLNEKEMEWSFEYQALFKRL